MAKLTAITPKIIPNIAKFIVRVAFLADTDCTEWFRVYLYIHRTVIQRKQFLRYQIVLFSVPYF